ncbi:glycosyl hydrolase-related protein [Paenibacillus solisilvae]|uniref:Glycosyl hydrolase-related protein n=1 Tax=Paenibacillus solisilvae TaxID=2486751 RepID=A0ABW0W4G1_9BACL
MVPDPEADQGEHIFTYALFPHQEEWTSAGTAKEAWALNSPLIAAEGSATLERFSLFALPSCDHVMIDAVKKSEDGDAVIVRLHEYTGRRGMVELQCGLSVSGWQETDLMERPYAESRMEEPVSFLMKPYEIKTLLLHFD